MTDDDDLTGGAESGGEVLDPVAIETRLGTLEGAVRGLADSLGAVITTMEVTRPGSAAQVGRRIQGLLDDPIRPGPIGDAARRSYRTMLSRMRDLAHLLSSSSSNPS